MEAATDLHHEEEGVTDDHHHDTVLEGRRHHQLPYVEPAVSLDFCSLLFSIDFSNLSFLNFKDFFNYKSISIFILVFFNC